MASLAGSIAGGQDTIVAVATPPGKGAISLVRMSGGAALEIASRAIHPWPVEPRRATLCRVASDGSGRVIDQALVTVFVAPDSFTGEDVVEISGHGGHYVPAALMATLIAGGARQATPGEFTRRAVLNGKMDITQAEAIGDIIDARSHAMHQAALLHLDGGLSRRVESLRSDLIALEALIAYDIDFPEEDGGPVERERISAAAESILAALDTLLATAPAGEIIREGAIVVIGGEPNVGKSSLFNALLGQSRAIVTEIPGTTRDAIEGFVETAHWPLRLVDTAGLRSTPDEVERIGIEFSERYLRRAHVVLACGDSKSSVDSAVETIGQWTAAPIIRVQTKGDLGAADEEEADVVTSAEIGSGLTDVLAAIDLALTNTVGATVAEMPILTRARHAHGIREARAELGTFGDVWRRDALPAPVAAVHLRSAVTALESLIGAVSTEDVLDRVFSSFCVGK